MFHILKPDAWAQCGEVYDICFENDVVPEGCLLKEVFKSPPAYPLPRSYSDFRLLVPNPYPHILCPISLIFLSCVLPLFCLLLFPPAFLCVLLRFSLLFRCTER
jgi:hypothetical protein